MVTAQVVGVGITMVLHRKQRGVRLAFNLSQFALGGKSYLDAGVRWEGTTKFNSNVDNSTVNFFGLRVAYAFDTK